MKEITKNFIKTEKNKNYELYINDFVYIYILRKRASRHSIIHLENSGDIIWEQLYPFGGMSRPNKVKSFCLKPSTRNGLETIVVLKGDPLLITGLDESIFVSSKERYKEGNVLFLNEREFCKSNDVINTI